MSRIGDRELLIPDGVKVAVNGNDVTVEGAKGKLELKVHELINVVIKENIIKTELSNQSKRGREVHGTFNSLIKNMIIGVTEGFEKSLETVGVGYKFEVKGNELVVYAGYSNPVPLKIPEGLTVEQKNNTEISISGIDAALVGEFAANIRKIRPPEPYKGKGIRYKGENVRRKEGKKAA